MVLLGWFACLLSDEVPGRPAVAEAPPPEAVRALPPAPDPRFPVPPTDGPPPCTESALTAALRRSDAAKELAAVRPVCTPWEAYAAVTSSDDGSAALFAYLTDHWQVVDVGRIDCDEPREEVAARTCRELVARWR